MAGGLAANAPPHVDNPLVAVFAGNHGVVAQGVSAYPPSVTQAMVANFTAGGAAINQICKTFDISLKVYDLRSNSRPATSPRSRRSTRRPARRRWPSAWRRSPPSPTCSCWVKWASATRRRRRRSIMRCSEAKPGVGRPGAGVDDEGLTRKADAVRSAVARHKQHLNDPLDISPASAGAKPRRSRARSWRLACAARRCCSTALWSARPPRCCWPSTTRSRPLPRRPCLGRARAPARAEAHRQGPAVRFRDAARRRLGRCVGGWRRQSRGRLSQRHGDFAEAGVAGKEEP